MIRFKVGSLTVTHVGLSPHASPLVTLISTTRSLESSMFTSSPPPPAQWHAALRLQLPSSGPQLAASSSLQAQG